MWEVDLDKEERKYAKKSEARVSNDNEFEDFDNEFYDDFVIIERQKEQLQ